MSDAKREIEELRREIAKLDAQVLAALENRATASRRAGELRTTSPGAAPVNDGTSLAALVAKATGVLPSEAVRQIFRDIYANCLALELPTPVAYLGPEGGFGQAAAEQRFGAAATLMAVDTVFGALDEVVRQRAQCAVVPIETRKDGPVQATIGALTESELKIIAAFESVASLHCMNRTGNLADVEKVYATRADQALSSRFIASLPSKVATLDVKSPHVACQLAREDHGAAAIATEPIGVGHGLEVANRSVLDDGELRVRYAVVGPRPAPRTGNDYTALAFSVQDQPGSLLDVLRQFAERSINLTKIQSRPAPGETWAYVFYVEIVGHATDRPIVAAVEEIKRLTKFFKVLGSYPA